MSEIMALIKSFRAGCKCGMHHDTTIRDIRIGSGFVHQVGSILKENSFPKKLLLVADRNTLKAAEGIVETLTEFDVSYHIYDDLRVAEMHHVEELETLIEGQDIGILSVGTGSVNDPCRMAASRQNKMLCIFATAPSMDGFASYNAPLVQDGFKITYGAKSPEVVIGDTAILAAAPNELKAAGFGDMMAKYVGLIDWQVSHLLTGEYYCEAIANLVRAAVDDLMAMADKVTANDEYTAGKIFESLLMTGIAMSFTQNSRPASGAEHMISHLIECVQLRDGIIPNFHGDDVGVATLAVLKYYNELAQLPSITGQKEQVDWDKVYRFFDNMADEVRKMNEPDNIVDNVDPAKLQECWPQIVNIIRSMPSYEEVLGAMKTAGCKLTYKDIGKPQKLFDDCYYYAPYIRRRLTLLRLRDMIARID